MFERYEAEIRADFARAGWSAQADVGGRLRYADAIALAASMAGDTSTSLGARLAGLRYPCTRPDLVNLIVAGGQIKELRGTDLYPIASEDEVRERESFKGTRREVAEAKKRMSGIFSGL